MGTGDSDGGRDDRPVALLTFRYFSIQQEAQGPTQSLTRLVRALGDRFRFKVISIAMPGEEEARWEQAFGVDRIAVAKGVRGIGQLRKILRETPSDVLVLNSFFDPQLTIAILLMRKLRLIPHKPAIVAPRGEFNPGALGIKPYRKQSYLKLARLLRLTDDVHLQATDELEASKIRHILPKSRSVLIAPNIRTLEPIPKHQPGEPGSPARFIFLSRIDRTKNLDLALRLLRESGVSLRFDIYGPEHNKPYWEECRRLISTMPDRVEVRYKGPIPSDQVLRTLAQYDALLLPTRGENFGHVIVESLLAGTPALISDRTPWRGLESARAGADLPLDDEALWLDRIRKFAAMSDEELAPWRAGARSYIEAALNTERDIELVAGTLNHALGNVSAAGKAAVQSSADPR